MARVVKTGKAIAKGRQAIKSKGEVFDNSTEIQENIASGVRNLEFKQDQLDIAEKERKTQANLSLANAVLSSVSIGANLAKPGIDAQKGLDIVGGEQVDINRTGTSASLTPTPDTVFGKTVKGVKDFLGMGYGEDKTFNIRGEDGTIKSYTGKDLSTIGRMHGQINPFSGKEYDVSQMGFGNEVTLKEMPTPTEAQFSGDLSFDELLDMSGGSGGTKQWAEGNPVYNKDKDTTKTVSYQQNTPLYRTQGGGYNGTGNLIPSDTTSENIEGGNLVKPDGTPLTAADALDPANTGQVLESDEGGTDSKTVSDSGDRNVSDADVNHEKKSEAQKQNEEVIQTDTDSATGVIETQGVASENKQKVLNPNTSKIQDATLGSAVEESKTFGDMFTDDKGLFQGGKEGRAFGRAKDYLDKKGEEKYQAAITEANTIKKTEMYSEINKDLDKYSEDPDNYANAIGVQNVRFAGMGESEVEFIKENNPELYKKYKAVADDPNSYMNTNLLGVEYSWNNSTKKMEPVDKQLHNLITTQLTKGVYKGLDKRDAQSIALSVAKGGELPISDKASKSLIKKYSDEGLGLKEFIAGLGMNDYAGDKRKGLVDIRVNEGELLKDSNPLLYSIFKNANQKQINEFYIDMGWNKISDSIPDDFWKSAFLEGITAKKKVSKKMSNEEKAQFISKKRNENKQRYSKQLMMGRRGDNSAVFGWWDKQNNVWAGTVDKNATNQGLDSLRKNIDPSIVSEESFNYFDPMDVSLD